MATLCVCDNGVGMEQAKLRGYLSSSEAENHFGSVCLQTDFSFTTITNANFGFSVKDTGTAVVILYTKELGEL